MRVNRKIQRAENFDGNIHLQDLTGQAQLSNNDPIDTDAMAMTEEGYLYASGVFGGRIKKGIKKIGKKGKKLGGGIGGFANKILENRNKVKMANAKAQQIAAKNLGKSDPSLAAALAQPMPVAKKEKKSNLPLILGIGAGVLLLIGVGVYLYKKKKGKGK